MHKDVERSVADINWKKLLDRTFTMSPTAWEDETLYFMLLDRFSDGNEDINGGSTPKYTPDKFDCAVKTHADAETWRSAGDTWVGGTIKGAHSKLPYLKKLGVTAIWISPVFKQVPYVETYFGYGIQNYLDVDPHLGTREDLKEFVEAAHAEGIRVIMDIIINHTGNVFSYRNDQSGADQGFPFHPDSQYIVKGFHDKTGRPTVPFAPINDAEHPEAWPDGAIWPREFQEPEAYTRKGNIRNWDAFPEYVDGDFFVLKDLDLGNGPTDNYWISPVLRALVEVYQFWIAYTDVDGYRIDTVKHMDQGAVRFFASSIHEFAQSLGKENFYLFGEVTGGRSNAYNTLETTGIDAVLGIEDIPGKLEYTVKGLSNPEEYFALFRNSLLVNKESQVWFRNKVVTLYDDHDQVRRGEDKARFAAGDDRWAKLALNALAFNATTMGIPCIYYGSEQAFDGSGNSDRFIRESMFGGDFGAFRTKNLHFFDESNSTYIELSKILALRKELIALRRGRQYLREISGDGGGFGFPHLIGGHIQSVIAWSRIFDSQHILCIMNTDTDKERSSYVTAHDDTIADGHLFECLYSSDPRQIGKKIPVDTVSGRLCIHPVVPPAGFAIYAAES